ncbi:hypothetical protein CO613_10220 [Lysobacteraceae bacterium NML07-0707]|nr:hypothetical protein CO613_10220 [Xanthomonadaceae bacterium NML07-0707]
MSGQTDLLYVLACASNHMQSDGTCTQWVWLPYPQQVLPPLTLAEGSMVALAIVGVWAVGLKARLVFRAARM